MPEWSLRELILLGVLRELGHEVEPDNQKGWAKCEKCGVSWWVRKRAELAGRGGVVNIGIEDISSQPMDFHRCDYQTANVSPT